jgi:hypothetical protein
MAQQIVTLCDPHVDDGESVTGQVFRLGVQIPGESWAWVEVDLCPDHAKPLVALVQELADHGRVFQPEGTAAQASGRFPCPECGRGLKTQDSLQKHMRRQHSEAARGPFTCEECGRSFPKAQGLAMHRTRAHRGFDPNV